LISPNFQVRKAAANALGKMGSGEAVPPLVRALGDEEENVRWFAVESLRKLGAVRATPQLCDLLRTDKSARVREIAATALGDLGQPAAVVALRGALDDENKRVQAQAAAALQALARDDFERMMIIADALAGHGLNPAARDVLRKAIQDFGGRAELQNQVLQARRRLGGLLKGLNDYEGAAQVYADMDKAMGGDSAVRALMLECWIAAGQQARIAPAFKAWLDAVAGDAVRPVVELGCQTADRLARAGRSADVGPLVSMLEEGAVRTGDQKLIERVTALKGRTEPTPETAPPAPEAPK
jgi:hypothetical protein